MERVKTYSNLTATSKISDLGLLIKFKLSLTVVFSAVMAYLILGGNATSFTGTVLLFVGGMLVTGAANALNQVLEKDFDVLMTRTKDRPIAAGRMSTSEGVLAAGIMSLVGITILGLFNPITAFLGMLSLVMYAFLYTPLKRFSSIAVLIGTFPGALPILIGGTAAQGYISTFALILFLIQVLWQLPHFWAIGWLGFDDYQKAGYKMLPVKDQKLDAQIGLYSFFAAIPLIFIGMIPFILSGDYLISGLLVSIVGIIYAAFSWKFYKEADKVSARKLMFSSFFYLPVVLIIFYIGSL